MVVIWENTLVDSMEGEDMPYCIYNIDKRNISGVDMQLVISNILPSKRQSMLPKHLIEYLESGLVKELCFNGVDFTENSAEIELIYVPHIGKVESLQTQRKINLLDIISSAQRKINLFFQNCSLPEKFITETIKLKASNPLISTEFGRNVAIDRSSNDSIRYGLDDASPEASDLTTNSEISDESTNFSEDQFNSDVGFDGVENVNSQENGELTEFLLPSPVIESKLRSQNAAEKKKGVSLFSRNKWSDQRSESSSSEDIDMPSDSS